MGFGTVGLSFFNVWVSVVYLSYSLLFFFLLMPSKHCRYCYYAIRDRSADRNEENLDARQLSVAEWKKSYLKKHVECGKRWGLNLFILWLAPIVLMVISFFLDFSILALVSLIGFMAALGMIAVDMRRRVCPTCAIRDECHASF